MAKFENVGVSIWEKVWLENRLFFRAKTSPVWIPQHSQIKLFNTYQPMKMEQIQCFETSGYKIQTPGNYPEENIQHSGHGESL